MRASLLLLGVIAGAVLAIDYATKQWVMANLSYHQPVELLGPYLRFTYTRNSGVAFGLGAGAPFPYYIFSIIAALAILYLFLRSRAGSRLRQVALSLILGGALGNLIDRLRWGEVVDFIEIGVPAWHWPVFNVADSAVTIGVILFALTWSHGDRSDATDAAGAEGAGPREDDRHDDARTPGVPGSAGG